MKRVLLGLLLVTIALIGICSVSAADSDSVRVDNSYVGLDDSYVSPILHIGDDSDVLGWGHDRNPRG